MLSMDAEAGRARGVNSEKCDAALSKRLLKRARDLSLVAGHLASSEDESRLTRELPKFGLVERGPHLLPLPDPSARSRRLAGCLIAESFTPLRQAILDRGGELSASL